MSESISLRTRIAAGSMGLLFFLVHAASLVWMGEGAGVLWVCHVASLLAAAGWFLGRPRPLAVALLWLIWGNGMWLLYLAGGGDLYPTSLGTHVGGLVLTALGVRAFGMPRRSWAWALGGMTALLLASRLLTPARDNVNLAHRVHEGWEGMFPHHLVYIFLLLCASALVFLAAETAARRLLKKA